MRGLMSVRPLRNGWLEFNIPNGWMRWWSSLDTTVESVRISAGMIVVISRTKNIWGISSRSLDVYHGLNSGFRLGSDSSSNVFAWASHSLRTSLYKSVTPSFARLDDIAVSHSPTLQVLRQECRKPNGVGT